MSASTPQMKREHGSLPPLASRFVETEQIAWEASRYEGIETKTLLVDPASGLLTMLMKMTAGSKLPDHEHVGIEQTWILEGSLECHEGSCSAGNFVWRPAGSRHEAWAGPNGVILIGFFQLPNKFFEDDNQVRDFLGRDWNELWQNAYERQELARFSE